MQESERIAQVSEDNLAQDKSKFLYEYARKSLDEDIENFQRVDNKASKFLTLVTSVLGVFVAIIAWILENQFPPNGCLDWILYVVSILTFFSLVCSWGLLFKTIKLVKAPRMPFNDQIDKLFFGSDSDSDSGSDLITIYHQLKITCRKALKYNRSLVEDKGKLLNYACRGIACSAWLVVVSALLIVYIKLNEV